MQNRSGLRAGINTKKATELVLERGGTPLFEQVKTVTEKFEVKCINGHIFTTYIDNINQGSWCRQCSSGLYERICRTYFEEIFGSLFPNTRQLEWLTNDDGVRLELDGYNEELKLAFEHQGEQHFTKKSQYPMSKYDELKRTLCKQNNIKLIEIPQLTTRLKIQDLPEFLYNSLKKLNFDVQLEKIKNINFTKAYRFSEHDELVKRGQKVGFSLISENSVISGERYVWRCNTCSIEIKRTIFQLEENGCQRCVGLKKIGLVDGKNSFMNFQELSDYYNLEHQTVLRLHNEGLSAQEIIDELLGDIRVPSEFPINQLSYHWDGVWFKSKNDCLSELGIKNKALETFRMRRNLDFENGLKAYLKRPSKEELIIFNRTFQTKKEVYDYTKVSETRVLNFKKVNPDLSFREIIEKLSLQFEGQFYTNLKELAKGAGVKYQTLVQRMSRNGTSVEIEVNYLRNKKKG